MAQPTQTYYKNSDNTYDSRYPAGNKPDGGDVILIGQADFAVDGLTPPSIYPGTSWAIGSFDGGITTIEDGWVKQFWPNNPLGATGKSWINFNFPPNTRKIGASFWTKMSDPGIALKFCKLFGIKHPAPEGRGYANSTFQMSGGGTMYSVSYGDGSEIDNDAGQVVLFDGDSSNTGRSRFLPGFQMLAPMSAVNGGTFNFADNLPHFMEIVYAQNSGTSVEDEVPNGEIFVRIDGNVHMDAKGLFNKYALNDFLEYLSLGNYAQGTTVDAYVYFKDVKVYLGGLPDSAVLLSRMNLASMPIDGSANVNGWGMGCMEGAVLSKVNDGTHDYLRIQYPHATDGKNYVFGGYTFPELKQEFYSQFYARSTGGQGCKFFKVFGGVINNGGGDEYANFTLGMNYGSGNVGGFSYGNGTLSYTNPSTFVRNLANDTGQILEFDDQSPWNTDQRAVDAGLVVTRGPNNSGFDDWADGQWHKFQIRARANSGTTAENETPDGLYELYIDDVLYVSGVGLFNRHYLNEFFETVNLGGWAQGNSAAFELHFRDGMTFSEGGWIA